MAGSEGGRITGQGFPRPCVWGSAGRRVSQATLRSVQGYHQIRGLARGLLLDTEGQNEWEKAGGLEVRPGPEGVTGEEWGSV